MTNGPPLDGDDHGSPSDARRGVSEGVYHKIQFHSNYYYRWQGGRWYRARDIQGPWVTIQLRALPSGLHAKGTSTQYRHERWGAVQERHDDRREAAQQERREIGGSRKTQRVAKASAVPGRSPAEPRKTKVRKHEGEDEEHPADRRVR